MLKTTLSHIKTSILLLLIFTVLTGLIYPLLVTGIAQLCFKDKANGSFIEKNGKIIGSKFIGQLFREPSYFWSRPSATTPFPYNAEASSGSNMGPTNPRYLQLMLTRTFFVQQIGASNEKIPVDLVTASGSGLDPHISPLAAFYQVPRIAKIRGIPEKTLEELIMHRIENRSLGILGEARINVLELNLALDEIDNQQKR